MAQPTNTFGAWSETALITISQFSTGSSTTINENFMALTETIDIDLGDKDIEQLVNLGGGRLAKKTPQDLTTITIELYPLTIGGENAASAVTAPTTATGIFQFFSETALDTSEPLANIMSRNRTPYKISIMWTDDTAATGALQTNAASTNAMRLNFAHFFLVSAKPSFTDGVLKVTAVFKGPPFNRNGIGNIKFESGNNGQVPAMNNYNATNYALNATSDYTW